MARSRRPLAYCAGALRQAPAAGAGALTADRRLAASPDLPQCAGAHRLRFPLRRPDPLLSPSRSRRRGALTPRGGAAALGRRAPRSRKTMYQPSRGAARRLGPCLRAYQARPQVRRGRPGGRRGGTTLQPCEGGARRVRRRSDAHRPPGVGCAWRARVADAGGALPSLVVPLGLGGGWWGASVSPPRSVQGGDLKGGEVRTHPLPARRRPELPVPTRQTLHPDSGPGRKAASGPAPRWAG